MTAPVRKVFVALSGLSPAVLPLTLFALAERGAPGSSFVPDEVVIVTTSVGRAALEQQVLAPTGMASPYLELRQVLRDTFPLHAALPAPRFVVPTRYDERLDTIREIDDAHDQNDLSALADALLTEVQAVTDLPNTKLVLSLSGGKKGMAHVAGQVMSLCGRPHDELVHIAVEPKGLERCKSFFFPTGGQYAQFIWQEESGEMAGCSGAEVEVKLEHQPYMPLRRVVHEVLTAEESTEFSFGEIVAALARQLDRTQPLPLSMTMVIRPATARVEIRRPGQAAPAQRLALQPQFFAYLQLLAECGLQGRALDRPLSDEDACRLLELWEAAYRAGPDRGDGWDGKQRYKHAHGWFSAQTLQAKDKHHLTDLRLESLQAAFKAGAKGPIMEHRKKKQGEMASELGQAFTGLLKGMNLDPSPYLLPVGRRGKGTATTAQRLPEYWQVEIV